MVVAALGVSGVVVVGPAGASTVVRGLDRCHRSAVCDLAALHHAFPSYSHVCSGEDCGLVAAADWESVAAGVTAGPGLLAAEYASMGSNPVLTTNFTALWQFWGQSGIDGEYLVGHSSVGTGRGAVEAAISSRGAVIAVDVTARAADIGVTRFGAGTADLIADGFTPKGPLVVYGHETLQMTWVQWRAQIRAVWLPQVSSTPPVPPLSTTLSVVPTSVPWTGGTVTLTFSAPSAATCSLTSTPSLWSAASVSVPCTGTLQVTLARTQSKQSWSITFNATATTGQTGAATQTLTQSGPPPPAHYSSNNWSGYVVPSSSALITDASGHFAVPTLNCADTPTGEVSTWVGIGGQPWSTGGSSGALLQTGINSSCVGGSQTNAAWWEVVPATPNTEQIFTNFPVAAGDQIQAFVYQQANGSWETLLNDVNTGLSALMVTGESWGVGPTTAGTITFTNQGSAVNISYDGGYTAEWIVEDPTDTSTAAVYPFANFGTVTFTNMLTSLSPWSLTTDEEWAIVQGGLTLATPSSTTADGFTDAYVGP